MKTLLKRLLIASLSLALLAACGRPPLTHKAATLSAQEQAIMSRLAFMLEAAPAPEPGRLSQAQASSRKDYRTQDTALPQAETFFYLGPYPQAQTKPTDYVVRGTGDWVSENPRITHSGTTTTTETYWSPTGQMLSPAPYTKVVERHGEVVLDLYATAGEELPDIPAFFSSRIELPASRKVMRAIETHQRFEDGTAVGYRWAVTGPMGLAAWIKAYRVSEGTGAVSDRYELFTDYQTVWSGGKSEVRPLRYAYGTYYPMTGIGQVLDQTVGPDGRITGTGAWMNLNTERRVDLEETIEPSGTMSRRLVYQDDDVTIVTRENYQPDGSGSGTVEVNDAPWAETTWNPNRQGSLELQDGNTNATYTPSRGKGKATDVEQAPVLASASAHAVLAGQNLVFQGHTMIGSGPTTGKGHMHANGNIQLSGSSQVDGIVSAGSAIVRNGYHQPQGGFAANAPTIAVPRYTTAQLQALAAEAKVRGIRSAKNAIPSGSVLSGYYQSSAVYDILNSQNASGETIRFSGQTTLTIDGLVFIEGKLDLKGSFTLTGNGLLICTEPITLGDNAKLWGNDASGLALVSLSSSAQAIRTSGSTAIRGLVFAPNGGIETGGNFQLEGALIAGKSATLASPQIILPNNHSLGVLRAAL